MLLGVHNILNILFAVAMCIHYGLNSRQIQSGISLVPSIDARLDKTVVANGAVIINNGYNSNLDSAKSSLQILKLFQEPYKYVVTPGLIDCSDKYEQNYEFGKIVARYATNVIIVKNLNKKPINDALVDSGFDMKNVVCVESFIDAKRLFADMDGNYVVLIENDLPDNYK